MKNKLIIVAIVFLIGNIIFGQKLELTMTLEKSNYVQYEPINIMVKIKNVDSKPITIPQLGFGYNNLELEVTNNARIRIVPFEIVEMSGQKVLRYTIMPGEEMFEYFDILRFGNQYSYEKRTTLSGSYFAPGTYNISVKYKIINIQGEKNTKKHLPQIIKL